MAFQVRVLRITGRHVIDGHVYYDTIFAGGDHLLDVPEENFYDPDGKECEALKRWKRDQKTCYLTGDAADEASVAGGAYFREALEEPAAAVGDDDACVGEGADGEHDEAGFEEEPAAAVGNDDDDRFVAEGADGEYDEEDFEESDAGVNIEDGKRGSIFG